MKGASAANTSLVGKYLSKKSCRQQHRVVFHPYGWACHSLYPSCQERFCLPSSALHCTVAESLLQSGRVHANCVPLKPLQGGHEVLQPAFARDASRRLYSYVCTHPYTHCPNVPGMAHRQSGAGSNVKIEGHEHLVTALSCLYRAGHSMSNSFVGLQPDDNVQCTGAYCFMGTLLHILARYTRAEMLQ